MKIFIKQKKKWKYMYVGKIESAYFFDHAQSCSRIVT